MVNNLAVSKLSSSIIDFFMQECRRNANYMSNTEMGKYLI